MRSEMRMIASLADKLLPSSLAAADCKDGANAKAIRPCADDFEHSFNECIKGALTDLLGAGVREALLDYFERHGRFARGDIVRHPRELTALLGKTFGKSGVTIERYIIRKFYATLNWEYKGTSDFDFKSQLEEARTYWKRSRETDEL